MKTLAMTDETQIPEGFQKTEVGIIPNDWIVKKLKDVAPLQRGFDLTNSEIVSGDYPVVYSNGIGNYHNKYTSKAPGVITGRSGTIGKIHYIESNYWAHNTCLWVTDFKNNSPLFIYYLFSSLNFNQFSSGSGVPTLNRNDLHDYKIPLPPKAEQTAIANALNDADELITRLEKLIAKKRNIKQGAMQESLKPKDDWEVKKLGECLSQNPDYGINAPAVEFDESLPVYLRITDITEDGKYSKKNIVSVDSIYSSKYFLEKDDLVFARTGASVGKTYLYNSNNGRLVFAGFLIRVKVNPKILIPEYFQFFTQTALYWDWIRSNSMRTGQPGINGNEYKELLINLPPTVDEQVQIAQILSDMDLEIERLETKLEKYKMLKQGMMQNLLTGKIRLVNAEACTE